MNSRSPATIGPHGAVRDMSPYGSAGRRVEVMRAAAALEQGEVDAARPAAALAPLLLG
jgi:hypothetical protein